jgi:hypothetical protein
MQISASGIFSDTGWEPYSALKSWQPAGADGIKTVYARFQDSAGNVSAATETSFALDTMPPIGGISLAQHVVGPATLALTLFLGAEDNLSGVADMRVSGDPAFADAPWLAYTNTLTLPARTLAASGFAGVVYVQYRDLAGNVSEAYSDIFVTDNTPPTLYVEAAAGDTLTRTVGIYGYDALAELSQVRLSNDPLLFEGLVTRPYTESVQWAFDDRRVVWVQVSDSVGNWTEPHPAYAAAVMAPQAPTATASLDAGGVKLAWAHLPANAHYEVWRDTTPYFDPTAPTTDTVKLDDVYPSGVAPLTFTDATVEPGKTYYYAVVGVNALGQASAAGNTVGVFRFGLIPGQ